jgi:hypothetical protein
LTELKGEILPVVSEIKPTPHRPRLQFNALDGRLYRPDTSCNKRVWFRSRVVCAKCGSRGNKIDVRPNWKEQPMSDSLTGKVFR